MRLCAHIGLETTMIAPAATESMATRRRARVCIMKSVLPCLFYPQIVFLVVIVWRLSPRLCCRYRRQFTCIDDQCGDRPADTVMDAVGQHIVPSGRIKIE